MLVFLRSSVLAMVALLLFSSTGMADEKKWVSLFDGKSMDGWEKVGKKDSVWEVKDGALSGSGLHRCWSARKARTGTFATVLKSKSTTEKLRPVFSDDSKTGLLRRL